jgi:tripartite-type tricarboxylate transporter receptor subunit TctC
LTFDFRPALAALCLTLAACAPAAAPSPTTPPAKPTEAPKPTLSKAEGPAATAPAKPTEAPAAKPAEAKAAASPPAKAEAKPADAKPAASPAAKPAFDEKAIADFYRGKTIKVLVGHAPGGGYDIYSRLIAKHIGKHIPGNPTLVVENMAGAGSLRALNFTYNNAPRDGTFFNSWDGGLVAQQLFGGPGVEFDATKLHFLGAPDGFRYIMTVTKRSGITKFEEILGPNAKEVVLGGVPNTKIDASSLLIREVLGAKVKLVTGYEGTAPIRLAMERGEVDGVITSWESLSITNMKDFESGEWVILVQVHDSPIEGLPQKNVPLINDLAKTEEQRLMFKAGVIDPNQYSRPYSLPPGVPEDRARAVEAAFATTMKDKEFLAEAEQAKISINPTSGQRIREMVLSGLQIPPAIRDKLKPILLPGT